MNDELMGRPGYDVCPKCGWKVAVTSLKVDARSLTPMPRQVERFVVSSKWQCLRYENHHGEWSEANDVERGEM